MNEPVRTVGAADAAGAGSARESVDGNRFANV